jgi:hypothetical protein
MKLWTGHNCVRIGLFEYGDETSSSKWLGIFEHLNDHIIYAVSKAQGKKKTQTKNKKMKNLLKFCIFLFQGTTIRIELLQSYSECARESI